MSFEVQALKSLTPIVLARSGSARPFPWHKSFEWLALRILEAEGQSGLVNIVLASDSEVRALNRTYRRLDKVTDVLSFEWHEKEMLGEIYIAEAQTKRQAVAYGVSYRAELKRLIIHGVLHLCGYDHLKPAERAVMRKREDFFLNS
jgi:probable rRNA maturation factor